MYIHIYDHVQLFVHLTISLIFEHCSLIQIIFSVSFQEFSSIFRRAFASRVFPPEAVEQLGLYTLTVIVVNASFLKLIWWDPCCTVDE